MKTRNFSILLILSLIMVIAPNLRAQWVQTSGPGSTGIQVKSLAVSGANLFVGLWGGGVWLSTDNGASIIATSGPTGSGLSVYSLAVSGSNESAPMLFAGTQGGGVYLTTDNGTTWTAASTGLTGDARTVWALMVIGTDLFAATNAGVYRSTDNGTSWSAASNGLTGNGLFPRAFAVSGSNFFVGTFGGVYRSTDNGSNWAEVDNGLTQKHVNSIAVSGSNLFVGTESDGIMGGGVFLSTNNGTSWTLASTGLPRSDLEMNINAILPIGTNLFAGTGYTPGVGEGIFLSTNNGTNWSAVNTGLTDTFVEALAVSGTNLCVGTGSGTALWHRPLAQMISTNAVSESPKSIESAPQAFPNPFLDKTTISISVTGTIATTITIINLIGQQVAQLWDGTLDAGEHSFTWAANGAPAGTYFCIVNSNGHVERTAMMLTR